MVPGVVFCCCSPSASGFDVLCVQTWYSAYIGCNEWLFEFRVVTVLNFHGMIIISENITVSRYHGIWYYNNQNSFFLVEQIFGSMCLFKFH